MSAELTQERPAADLGPARPPVSRDVGLDLVRIVASIMVVLIHTSVDSGWGDYASPNWLAIDVYDSIARPAVPLFFLVTGALLVPRAPDWSDTWKRVWRLAIPLVVWSEIYLIWFWWDGQKDIAALNPLQIVQGRTVYHFWYFYTLLGLYFFLPLLQAFYRAVGQSRLLWLYVAIGFLAAGFLPIVQGLFQLRLLGIDLPYFTGYAAYLLIGAVLMSRPAPSTATSRLLLVAGLVLGLTTAAGTYVVTNLQGKSTEVLLGFSGPLVALASICIFRGVRGVALKLPVGIQPAISRFAPVTFGIYTVHVLVLFVIEKFGIRGSFTTTWIGVPIVAAFVWTVSAAAVWLLRRIPRIGKLILP